MDRIDIRVSIVIPVYNEDDILINFHELLRNNIDILPYSFSVFYINDGSTDGTQRILDEILIKDSRVKVIELSRNFGHQAAITAGMNYADGDVVITMDGDGQHPPSLIEEMLKLFSMGYDIVQTKRVDTDFTLKRITSSAFYRFINLIGDTNIIEGTADYRLLSQQVTKCINSLPEYHRFIRGMVAWVGFKSVILTYQAPQRLGGKSKFSTKKMLKLAEDAIFSFSLFPMRLSTVLGGVFFVLAFMEMIYVLTFWLRGKQNLLEPGWSSLMFVILISSGFILFGLGTVGLYIGHIFQEIKHRPNYLIREIRTKSDVEGKPENSENVKDD